MKAKTFRKTFPMLPAIALTAATIALALPARATTFVKDVMLIGGTSGETTALKNSLTSQGWTFIDYDLNSGASGDYVYLLYKAEENTDGVNRGYVTDFYLREGKEPPSNLTYDGRQYSKAAYDGGEWFVSHYGDLNSNSSGSYIYLYYTKDAFPDNRAVTSITFNDTSVGAVPWSGNGSAADLNKGCGSDTPYIYMHFSTLPVTYVTTYTIGYTLNGGTLPSVYPTSYTIETATFTLVNPTRTGYTFRGWTWSGQSTPQTSVTIPQGSTGNRSYTANWTPVTYSISYTLNGGSNASGNPASYNVNTATFTLNNPTRTGYTFAGWTGTGLPSSAQTTVTISKGSTGNKSYTANWTPVTYNIGYDLDSGTLPSSHPTTYNIESANFTLVNPTRTGYTFAGWTGTGLSSAQTSVTIARGSTGDRTYTANWNANPKGSLDVCEGFANYITLSGWAFDPDEPSLSISVLVQVFRGDGGALLSEHSLTADLPRNDVNTRYGITGQHGFRTTILVAEAGSCTVKAWVLDTSDGSLRTQVGDTITVATTVNANIVQLDDIPIDDPRMLVTYEAHDGDVLVGSTPYNVNICIADGATVTLFGAHVDRIKSKVNASAIYCRGDATLVLASGTENSATGNGDGPGVRAGPPGTTLVICGGGTLNASNNDMSWPTVNGLPYRSAAGIGSFGEGNYGDIVIEGGTINATGGRGCPGIGTSPNGTCGSVSISDGVFRVTATAGENAPSSIGPGIGGSCGAVTIGGVETGPLAQSPYVFAPSVPCTVHFDANGGTGGMADQTFSCGMPQSLDACAFTAPVGYLFDGWNTAADGTGTAYANGQSITVSGDMTLYAQWSLQPAATVALANGTGEVTLHNGDMLTGTGGRNTHVTIADGATVWLDGVNITKTLGTNWAGIICEGDATIILVGDNAVKGGTRFPGISVPEGKTLTIQGGGSLSATGGFGAAGIGGGMDLSCGNIVIEGGAITATGNNNNAAGIGTCNGPASCGNITIGAGITSLVATGTPCIGGKNNPNITIAPVLVSEGSLSGGTFTLTPATGYERWTRENGFSGAWDATDASGVHNVFRYAFNKPTGAFTNPPLISISFENGQPVVHTPPLVNSEVYTFSILATDTLDGTGASATYPLNASGRTEIPASDKPARFFRLRAVEQ